MDEGIVYEIEFKHCRLYWMVRVHVKSINITFGPAYPDGPMFKRECGETIFVHKKHKVTFTLSKEEALSLLPENRPETLIPVKFDISVENIYGNR